MVAYAERLPGTEVAFEMVPVAGGTFRMGSPPTEPGRNADEGPTFMVQVEPFWMGKCEVTWSEYKPFMQLYELFKAFESRSIRQVTDKNRADAITAPTPLYDPSFTYALGEDPREPAVTMSQYAAKQYTKWLTGITGRFYRLPTEAEWEYACRAGSTGAYCFGDDPDQLRDYAWYFDNSDDTYHDVGQKKPNAWGLHDMHGNVGELVLDQYGESGYQRFGGRTVHALEAIVWPAKMFQEVIRGGGWDGDPEQLRCAARAASQDWRTEDPNFPKSPWWFTDEQALVVGFRVVRPAQAPPDHERFRYWEPTVTQLQKDVAHRVAEGRGVYGLVDRDLPKAAEEIRTPNRIRPPSKQRVP